MLVININWLFVNEEGLYVFILFNYDLFVILVIVKSFIFLILMKVIIYLVVD